MFQERSIFQVQKTKSTHSQAEAVYAQDESIYSQSKNITSSDDSFCLQMRIQGVQSESMFAKTSHLITDLTYKLKLHHKRNQCLTARFDTCTDVNIMPASAYKLVFCGPDLKKLTPSRLEIGTYTTNTVMLVHSCTFYLVHPNTKQLQGVTFYVATNNGSVLLSCATIPAFGLIQLNTKLNYLPSRASLITCNVIHPKKTKSQLAIHVSRSESTVFN